ncbi:microneme MIC14 [Babesia ovis]|uniref:Microneme MIC14 n=1 Tax=Babesia ovis TaxID=5869 RepID=A0A9W5TB86_BABOV|nr:microneme MIC14 [Babesia ovis]
MQATLILTLSLLLAVDTAVKCLDDNVYCQNTILKAGGTFSVQQCHDLCLSKAAACPPKSKEPTDGNQKGAIAVDKDCFNKAHGSLKQHCVFSFEENVKTDIQVASGLVAVKANARVTVNFTQVTNPLIFAQVLSVMDQPQYGKVIIHDLQDTSAILSVEPQPNFDETTAFEGEYYVAWFVIGEDAKLQKFGAYHMHLQKFNFNNVGTENITVQREENDPNRWPENVAMFVQPLSPNIDTIAQLKVASDAITMNITTVEKVRETVESLEERPLDVALLLVDLDYFKIDGGMKFGTTAISVPMMHPNDGTLNVKVTGDQDSLLLFTPYYNRVSTSVPKATCWSDATQPNGRNFTCKMEPSTMVTLPHMGKPNVVFLAIHKIAVVEPQTLAEFKYNICSVAFSSKNTTPETEGFLKQSEDDIACKQRCTGLTAYCKKNINCLQTYVGKECTIEGAEYKDQEVLPREHMFMDALKVLNYELRGAVCTGMFDAVKVDVVANKKGTWVEQAINVCKQWGNWDKIMVIIDEHISFNICSGVIVGSGTITWKPLATFKDQYIKDGKPLPVSAIFKDYEVYGICQYQESIELHRYYEYRAEDHEEDIEPANSDCIESQWEEWGEWSQECIPEKGKVVRKRFRYVMKPASGDGRKCVTEEVEESPADALPPCKDVCLVTEWSEWSHCIQYQRQRERYVKQYSSSCDTMQMTEVQGCMINDDMLPGWDDEDEYIDGEDYDATLPLPGFGLGLGTQVEERHVATQQNELRDERSSSDSRETDSLEDEDDDEEEEVEEDDSGRHTRESTQEEYNEDEENMSLLETSNLSGGGMCELWSEWSGCTSACDDEVGYQYKLSSYCDAHNIYDLKENTETRKCEKQEDCGLTNKIQCKTVKSIFYSENDNQRCIEECERLVEVCKDEKETNMMQCFARLKADSAESGGFFFNCMLPGEEQKTLELYQNLFRNKCFISKAVYSDTEKTWASSTTKSCHCAIPGSIPCTPKEVHATRVDIYRDLIESGFCPSMNYKQAPFNCSKENAAPDSLTYVSLAGNKRLHCPLAISEDLFTYTDIGDDELQDYCRHGPIFANARPKVSKPVTQYEHNYDCATVVSAVKGTSDLECASLCRSMRLKCASHHEGFLKCVRQRLTSDFQYESTLFRTYNCRMPQTLDVSFDADFYRIYVSTFEAEQIDKRACSILVQNAIMHCEADDLLNNHNSLAWCMASMMEDIEPTTSASPTTPFQTMKQTVANFKQKCKFVPSRKAGNGYVMCRFPTEKERYDNWSEWSVCTSDCNEFDNVGTRYRTRKAAKGNDNAFFHVGDGTLQFELCLDLEGCEKGRWVDSIGEEDRKIHILDYEAHKENSKDTTNSWLEQTYSQHPELRNSVGESVTCHIFKSHKIISAKGVTCGCPSGHKPCSFASAMGDPMWMTGMQNFCRNRPLASILFEGEISKYEYHCKIGMLLKHTEEGGALACDYYDNNEYVACQDANTKPLTLRSKHFSLLGVCLGIVFCMYATMRHIVKRRRARVSQQKKTE